MARLQDQTMQSDFLDLQSRLEHLITYSSQLVFVSGDGMGKQLNFAQHFLSQQNELANIGYVDASEKVDVVTYRKKFIQQLVGPLKVDYSKPLTVLIPRLLKEQSQFILIAVTHAEFLPDEFMQELWDLVLQNRFAKNRHHLNILVFGEKQWASRAKSWLPANSHNKPVLLANESVDRNALEPRPNSELDQLIASKREQFNERIAARELKQLSAPNMLNQWWVKLLLSVVFLVTFTGILLTPYVSMDQAKAFYASIFDGKEQVSDVTPHVPEIVDLDESVKEVVDTQPEVLPVNDKPSFLHLPDDQRRVVDWDDAVKSLPEKPIDIANDETSGVSERDDANAFSVAVSGDNESTNVTEAITNTQIQDAPLPEFDSEVEDYDYPVEDITSVEQLDTITANQFDETDVGSSLPVSEETVGTERVESDEQITETTADPESQSPDYFFDEVTLLALPLNNYALQLSAMSTEEAIAFFLQANQLNDTVWIYKTQRFGGDWFVILHNQTYSSLDEANAAIQALGLQSPPFAKPIVSVQQEISLN